MRIQLSYPIFALLVLFSLNANALENSKSPVSHLFGGSFDLIDHHGRAVSDKDFLGRFVLIYFGYTYCPDICPTGLSVMASALDELGEDAKKIQPVFVTVDPKRDRPETLKSYVEAFHPRLIGLSGSEKQVADAAKAYRVHRSKVLQEGKETSDYLVNHSSLTYLMGPKGEFLTMFPHGSDPSAVAQVLRRYMD